MQTLKNFIREALIIEGDESNDDGAGSLSTVEVLSSASGNPRHDAMIKSINELLNTKKDAIESDVDAELSKWSGGGPGTIISDADVLNLRKSIVYLLDRDFKGGQLYPYRTALFLTGYDKGITTFGEILEETMSWALAASVGPIKYMYDSLTAEPMGGEPDSLAKYEYMGMGAGIAGGVWLLKHIAAHYLAEKGAKLAMKTPIAGEVWKSISAGRMLKVVEDPDAWKKILTQFRIGVEELGASDIKTSIIRPLRAYRDGVLWRTFKADYDIVTSGLINAIQKPHKALKVSILEGETGAATSRSIGTLEFDLNKLIDINNSFKGGNDPSNFVDESIRLALKRTFKQGGYEAAETGKSPKISSIDQIFEIENPFSSLFSNSDPEMKDLAMLIDSIGNKKDQFSKFETLLVKKIQGLVDPSTGKLPNDIVFTPGNLPNNPQDLPAGFRIDIANSTDAKNFVNELIDSKMSLKKLINYFVPAVEQMTTLGKLSKFGRTLEVGLGAIATALASAGLVAGAGGGLSTAILGEDVDEVTAVKLATDAKIRGDGHIAFISILEQEPDIDFARTDLPLPRGYAARFKRADEKLNAALAVPAGGDEDAVVLMSEALNLYKAALGSQSPTAPTNEHTINLLGKLVREYLNRR